MKFYVLSVFRMVNNCKDNWTRSFSLLFIRFFKICVIFLPAFSNYSNSSGIDLQTMRLYSPYWGLLLNSIIKLDLNQCS